MVYPEVYTFIGTTSLKRGYDKAGELHENLATAILI
jgi:hypothetical protein